MPNFITQLGQQMGAAASGGILGMAFGAMNDQRQYEQQKKLMADQEAASKRLKDYDQMNQYNMWLKTGAVGQMEQLKKAGLNPGLMYGMSGAGGATTGSPGGGSVGGGAAPSSGGENVAMMGMGIQMRLQQAQEKLLEAQAENVQADTDKKKGVDTQETAARRDSLLQGIENAKAQQWMTKVDTRLKEIELGVMGSTVGERISRIVWESQRALEEMNMARNEAYISKETMEPKIEMVKKELVGLLLKNALTKSQTELTDANRKKIPQELANWSIELMQKWRALTNEDFRTFIEKGLKERGLDIQETGQVIDALDNILKYK